MCGSHLLDLSQGFLIRQFRAAPVEPIKPMHAQMAHSKLFDSEMLTAKQPGGAQVIRGIARLPWLSNVHQRGGWGS